MGKINILQDSVKKLNAASEDVFSKAKDFASERIDDLQDSSKDMVNNLGSGCSKILDNAIDNAKDIGENIKEKIDDSSKITQDGIMKTLEWSYQQTINGIPGQKNIDEFINDYLSKYDEETAIDKMINFQISKAGVSGFLTGMGGLVTLPVAVPANITTVILFQMRMVAAIARIRGYDLNSDQVQTFVYTTLTGTTVKDLVKQSGINIGNKLATTVVKRIPGAVLTKINQKVGFRLFTKFGTKGAINMGKMIPVVGGVIGCGVDIVSTKAIANSAKKTFTKVGYDLGEGEIVPKEFIDAEVDMLD